METTLIYFSVKAVSATYILYKVWMFIFSPKVYKFWNNQLRYKRWLIMSNIRPPTCCPTCRPTIYATSLGLFRGSRYDLKTRSSLSRR